MTPRSDTVAAVLDLALEEDIGPGDWTTLWTIPEESLADARILAKGNGVLAGTEVVEALFERVDPGVEIEHIRGDGSLVAVGDEVTRLRGPARSILTGERIALNFLQRLSGIATLTRAFVEAIAGTTARVLDTRKTTPGLRHLEKEAVLAGGGFNHRFGLHDMVLIKENHIRAAGGITAALDAVRRHNTAALAVEIETTNLDEVREAIRGAPDRILLDNMELMTLREAVALISREAPRTETEASGGVTLETIRSIADTGVDFISVGALTHSAPALDLSLLIRQQP